MKKILLKLFVKNYQDKENPVVRAKYGVLAGVFGIITNLLVCSVKIIVGLLSASVSILADGINNLSDAGASIVTFIGFHLSSKPADEEHPFGHERYEYLSGMIVSIIILIIGGSLFTDSTHTHRELNVYEPTVLTPFEPWCPTCDSCPPPPATTAIFLHIFSYSSSHVPFWNKILK